MKRKKHLRTLLVLLGLMGAAFLVLTWTASSRLIAPQRRPLQDYHRETLSHPNDYGLRIVPFTVKSETGYDTPCLLCEPSRTPGPALKGNKLRSDLQASGLNLSPWGEVSATLVLLHGHSGRKEDFLPVAERFCAAGFRCLLVDLPGHGDNPAPYATFGYHEASLPHEVLLAASHRFAFDPALAGSFGVSQGGAIALQSAIRNEENWFTVAELSSFASLDALITEQAVHYFGPLRSPAGIVMRWLVAHRAGFQIAAVRPIDAAAHLQHQAVLIGHGDADSFVSPRNAQDLWDAVPSQHKQFLHIPGATHSTVFVTSAPVYVTLCRFFIDSLPAPKA